MKERKSKRKFVEAKNSEEAEGIILDTSEKVKSKKRVLTGEDLLDKFRLLFSHYDFMGYFDVEPILNNKDILKIKEAIRTERDYKLYLECLEEYKTIKRFGNRLKYCFKCFQTSFSCLAVLLNRLDNYEDMTISINIIAKLLTPDKKTIFIREIEDGDLGLQGVKIVYNGNTGLFELNDNELYEEILKEASVVANELADFKAHVEAADDYIEKSKLKYTPIGIMMSWENAVFEKYTRYLVKNRRYFLSEFFSKVERGEKPTAEEERYSVIADYQEVKRNERTYIDCLEDLGIL